MKKLKLFGSILVVLFLFVGIAFAAVSTNSSVTGVLTSDNVFAEYSGAGNFSSVTVDQDVGVGIKDNILGKLHIQTEGEAATIYLDSYSDVTAQAPVMVVRKARGTIDTPTAIQSGDYLFTFTGRGYNGSAFTGATALFRMAAEENWDESSNGTYISFQTTEIGGIAPIEKFRVTGSGNIGINTTSPTAKLHVNGSVGTAYDNVSSASVAIDNTYNRIDCLTNDNAVTLNLPTAVGIKDTCYFVRIINASGNKCFAEGAGSETLSNDGIAALLNYSGLNTSGETIEVCSDGANWQVWE